MAESDDDGQQKDPTFEDSRNMWIFLCFLLGLPTSLGFFLRHFEISEAPPTTDFIGPPWVTWLMFVFLTLLYGSVVLMGAMDLYEYYDSMRLLDRLGLSFGVVGYAICVWDLFFRQIVFVKSLAIPSPAESIALTVAGCMLLYGKYRSKTMST